MTTDIASGDEPSEPHGAAASAVGERPESVPGSATASRFGVPEAIACLAVFTVGFVLRLGVVLTSSGGLTGEFTSYDTNVYYAAGDALSFGRLPYRDFTLLHPPGLPVVLTPFAMLGRLTSDHIGFMAAAVAFMALGAANAALVVLVARRIGAGLAAATLGGLFAAAWLGSIRAEYQVRLEPLGNALILCGLLAYLSAERSGRRHGLVWAGVAFAAAASVKIWWAVPVVVLVCWQLARGRRHRLLPVAAGAAAGLVVIDGPFLAAAPSAMWRMVVTDQLTRSRVIASPMSKGRYLIGGNFLDPGASSATLDGLVLAGAAVLLVLMVAAWRLPAARLVVALLAAQLGVLALAPSWFGYYADYLTPSLAVTLAAGCAAIRWRQATLSTRMANLVPAVTVVTVVVTTASAGRFLVDGNNLVIPFPSAQLTSASTGIHCLMSDESTALILADALSRDMRNGCPNWVDVSGRTYGSDKDTRSNGRPVPRVDNPAWQRDLRAYLTSGDAVIITRRTGAGESAATLRAVRSGGIYARVGRHTIYRTPHRRRSSSFGPQTRSPASAAAGTHRAARTRPAGRTSPVTRTLNPPPTTPTRRMAPARAPSPAHAADRPPVGTPPSPHPLRASPGPAIRSTGSRVPAITAGQASNSATTVT